MKPIELDEFERKVILAIKPDYDVLVLVIPSNAGINDFAAADALAKLKKKKLIAFDGRGRFRSCYLTPDGCGAFETLEKEAA
jgi:hypothetical protein